MTSPSSRANSRRMTLSRVCVFPWTSRRPEVVLLALVHLHVDVDLVVADLLEGGVGVPEDVAPRLVGLLDAREGLDQAVAIQDRPRLELVEPPVERRRGNHGGVGRIGGLPGAIRAGDLDLVDVELVALDHGDRDAHAPLGLLGLGVDDVDLEDRVLDDDVLVALGLVDPLDALDVRLVVRLAVRRVLREDSPERRDLRLVHRVAQGLRGDVGVARELDRLDLDLVALVDDERHLLLGLGDVLDLELHGGAAKALLDVEVVDRRSHLREVLQRQGRPRQDLDLRLLEPVLDLRGRDLLVAAEVDELDDRTLLDGDDQRHAAGRALGLDVEVLEEADVPEGVKVRPDLLGVVRVPDLDAQVVRDRVGRDRLVADDPDPHDSARRARPTTSERTEPARPAPSRPAAAGCGLGRRRGRRRRSGQRRRLLGVQGQRRHDDRRGHRDGRGAAGEPPPAASVAGWVRSRAS